MEAHFDQMHLLLNLVKAMEAQTMVFTILLQTRITIRGPRKTRQDLVLYNDNNQLPEKTAGGDITKADLHLLFVLDKYPLAALLTTELLTTPRRGLSTISLLLGMA